MTTTKYNDISNAKSSTRSCTFSPFLYSIQYPNCRTGMFSFRAPYKDFHINNQEQEVSIPSRTRNVVHPEYLYADQSKFFVCLFLFIFLNRSLLVNSRERPFFREQLKRDAEIQCSLISSDIHDRINIRRHQVFVTDSYNNDDLTSRYHTQLNLQLAQPTIYEVWSVATPSPRSMTINQSTKYREPSIRIRSPRVIDIQSLSDDEPNYDDYIIYTHYPRRTYLPVNV